MIEKINRDTFEYRPKTPEEIERQRIFDQKVTQAIKTYTNIVTGKHLNR